MYSIALETEVERAWCLVYARKQKDAVVIALEHLDKDFFQVHVAFSMIPWLDVPSLGLTHLGDSLTTNIIYTDGNQVYTNAILTHNSHLRGRRASVQQMDDATTIWLGTCLHHVSPQSLLSMSGGANYYIASANNMERNMFFGQVLAMHDTDLQAPNRQDAEQQQQQHPQLQSAASPALRPATHYSTNGVTVKVEMITLMLNNGSKCLLKEYI